MNVLYKTRLLNPRGETRIYVGIHSLDRGPLWTPDNREGYIGSSGIFCLSSKLSGYEKYLKPGWVVCSVTKLQENATLKDETELIHRTQLEYGIAPECRRLVTWIDKIGFCVNVSRGSDNLSTPGIRKKAADSRTAYYRTEEGRKDLRSRLTKYTSEMRSKHLKSDRSHLDRLVKSSHTEESLKKRRKTYRESGNAKRVSDIGNAAIIAKARKCILNDGFIGVCSEITEHTGLKRGSVGAKMSIAYKEGEAKCLGWIFKPYTNDTD